MDKASHLAARSANDIKRSLEKIAAIGLTMGAAIATGTAALIEGSIDAADKLGKLAEASGTTAETLSVLSYAGKLAGVETEQLGKGLEKLSQAAFKAQNGNQGLQNIFGRLGVSAVDSNGHLKDSGELMEQLAVKFAGMGDGAGKTALAMALFGKAGAGLIPFLNLYGAKQAEINEQAHRFGLELSTSTVQLAAQAKEKLDGLKSVATGFGFALLSSTLPALDKLASQLIKIAEDANIPDLGKAFGEKVVTAVTALGDAMMFAEKHAHALKIAFEGLAGLKLATIAIPVISDLANGGIDKATSGIGRFILQSVGLTNRVIPALVELGSSAKYNASFIALMASEEGIAAAASYAWSSGLAAANAALSTMAGLLGVTVAGLGIFGAALVSEKAAAEKLAGVAVTWGDMWHAAMKNVQDDARVLLDILKGDLPKAIMDLSSFQSLRTRAAGEAKARPVDKSETLPPPRPKLPPPNTAGLGPDKKDVYGEEIKKLDLAIASQRAYLSVLDGTPEKIAAISAQEKAAAVILELTNKLVDEHKLKKGQSMALDQQAAIISRVTLEENLKALVDYGKEIVGQQHGAELAIKQLRAMAAANLEGDAAVRRAAIDNAILGLTFLRTGDEADKMSGRVAELRTLLNAKSSIEIVAGANKQIDSLRDELAQRQLITAATLGSIDAQRQASLASKTFKLDQNIAEAPDDSTRDALLRQRDALVELTKAEWAANDAESARSLLSPDQEYERSADALNRAVEALKALQGGTLTYAQQLGIAAKQQDEFNKATDSTVDLLLREGSLGDGVSAFFLKMQEQAKTAAATIFDVLNETFNKLSDNLTQLITAPNRFARKDAINAFATSFENIGKNLLDSQIKVQLQSGLGALGKIFPGLSNVTGSKRDGSTVQNALWVMLANGQPGNSSSTSRASAGGNELDDLLGAPPSPQSTFPSMGAGQVISAIGGATSGQPGPVGILGGLLSGFGKVFGAKQASTGALGGETLGFPTSLFGSNAPGGGNELDNLTGDLPAVVKSIPQLLRRTPQLDTGLTAGEDTTSTIPIAPDVQPQAYSLITRPQPSALGGILQSVIGLGSKLFGGLGFSGGGHVSGPGSGTSDSIRARLSHGEFVTKAAQTAKFLPLLQAINSDTLKFAGGGYVGYDNGGFVSPNTAYMPASRDYAAMSSASSRMAASSSSSSSRASMGDTHNHYIDARGSNDPAQVTAQIDRYMRTAAPQIAAMAVTAVKDQQLRRAPSAR
jgi:hypothetical protein